MIWKLLEFYQKNVWQRGEKLYDKEVKCKMMERFVNDNTSVACS